MRRDRQRKQVAMEETHISIILVSYNTADWIGTCLDSIEATGFPGKEIFVIDNASTDGGVRLIRDRHPGVHLIVNAENRGFAAANNQALPHCTGKYVFFLNPDTRMEDRYFFLKVMAYMESHPRVGLAGTRVVNLDGSPQESVSLRYPGERFTSGELIGLPGPIACVLGASMIVRSGVLKAVGGFDEEFFLYGEDQDLCLRIRRSGYEIGYIEDAVIVHVGGHSEHSTTSADVWGKKARAEYLFYDKHYRPDTILRISRSDRIKSLWRMAILSLFGPLAGDREKRENKLGKYRVIYDTLRERRDKEGSALNGKSPR